MNGDLQTRINPPTSKTTTDFSDAKVKQVEKAVDASPPGTSFKDLIMNSNEDAYRARAAQKNGDGLKTAKTDAEFAKAMQEKLNKENLRRPQNELDKDAFLKLFITQMQNQDPLNPDNSAEMASQLAQFHGLEQMLNVNKNLEKMQSEAGIARAVGLIDFVGKEVKLNNGKLAVQDGKVSEGFMTAEIEAPKATLEVRDASGVVIATRDLGFLKKGEHKVEWDGLNNVGMKASNGTYTFSVLGKDLNDQDVPVKITSLVKVTGVDLKDEGGSFYTELGKIRIDEVASVGMGGVLGKTQMPTSEDAKRAVAAQAIDTDQAVEEVAAAMRAAAASSQPGGIPEPNPAEKPASPAAAAPQTGKPAAKPAPVAAEDRSLSQPITSAGSAMEFPIAAR